MRFSEIGKTDQVYIVAEISANHNQDLQIALRTVEAIAESGADAVKLQTYTADTITIDVKSDDFKIDHNTLWDGRYLYDLYKEAHTPWDWHEALFKKAKSCGLECFSSPFDFTAVDFLEQFDVPAYKIASFEIQDVPLIDYVARKGKPVVISTGIATEEDIWLAIETCRKAGNENIILLKCTSAYPAPVELSNLRTMVNMSRKFGVLTGLSDHTLGTVVPVAATTLGAVFIEKHFILDRSIGGPDATFSLEPAEFKEMADNARLAAKSLGKVSYELSDLVQKNRKFSRSLFITNDVKKGELLTPNNMRSIRPGFGLHPKHYSEVLGRISSRDLKKGEALAWEMII